MSSFKLTWTRSLHSTVLNRIMSPKYTLLYWGKIPGRGEYIRLPFEYTKTTFKEINDYQEFSKYFSPKGTHFAPPLLQVEDAGSVFTLSQTPAILAYLAPKLGLAGSNEHEKATINQLTLTALDLSNEAHDVHHPIASSLYYEDQKPEAKRRAEDFTATRIPKFLTNFESVLQHNNNNTGVLVGSAVSTADLVLFHVIEGLLFAFPKRMDTLRKSKQYTRVFQLHEKMKEELKDYLESGRRLEFSEGVYRHYAELDQK